MPLNLSPDEVEAVEKDKRKEAELPLYYNSDSKQSEPISRDFEAYLILQGVDQKQVIQEWISAVKEIELDTGDRDALLTRFMEHRAEDAALKIEELDEVLGGFDQFKQQLFSDPNADEENPNPNKYSAVAEIDLFARAVQKPIDEVVMIRDGAFHEQNMILLVQTDLEIAGNKEARQGELDTWQQIFAAYKGQSA
jgi:hypothetical protein